MKTVLNPPKVIFILRERNYCKSDHSLALPEISAETVTWFINDSLTTGRLEWMKRVRVWAEEVKSQQ